MSLSVQGSTVKSVYGEREVKVYGIHEPELDTISYFNTASTVLFSFGSFAISISARNGVNTIMFGDITTYVALVLFALGIFALVLKQDIVSKIKNGQK